MGSAQRRANIFPIESAHLDEVRVECSSEERERRAKAAQAESVVKTLLFDVDGQPVADAAGLLRRVAAARPGQQIVLTLARKGKTQKLTVTLGERDERKVAAGELDSQDGESVSIGVALRPVTAREARQLKLDPPRGLYVVEVEDGSPAEQGGLRAGDVIVQANQRSVGSLAELGAILEESVERGVVVLLVKRRGQTLFRTIPLGE